MDHNQSSHLNNFHQLQFVEEIAEGENIEEEIITPTFKCDQCGAEFASQKK